MAAGLRQFLSTHPRKDATERRQSALDGRLVSIHASPQGCDPSRLPFRSFYAGFNPRIPARMRQERGGLDQPRLHRFNPRIPARMRLGGLGGARCPEGVSIHASPQGCDAWPSTTAPTSASFNPRIPARMRLRRHLMPAWEGCVSIHASPQGCDLAAGARAPGIFGFNPRIPPRMRLLHLVI